MTFVDTLKKTTSRDITLYGEAALHVLYDLPGMPSVVEYTCDTKISQNELWKRLETSYKVDYNTIRVHAAENIHLLCSLDCVCYAIHTKNMDVLVDYILCNLNNFDSAAIRERYAELYGSLAGNYGVSIADVQCVMPIDKYYNNIKESNIAKYMKKRKLSYSRFRDEVPKLCKKFECNEDGLNEVLGKEFSFDS